MPFGGIRIFEQFKEAVQKRGKTMAEDIKSLLDRIDALRDREKAVREERSLVRRQTVEICRKLVEEFDITAEDLRLTPKKPAAPADKREPRYINPDTGETWCGRGKAPNWFTEKMNAGVRRESLLIRPDGDQ